MSGRLPTDAFEYYTSLGEARSYQAVADHYGVSKRAVTKRAARDTWQDRLTSIEHKARERSDEKLVDVMAEMKDRHLKTCRVILGKGLEALRTMPLDSAMSAVRAIDVALKHERTVMGEPAERQSITVEEIIRREYETWMTTVEEPGDEPEPEPADGSDA